MSGFHDGDLISIEILAKEQKIVAQLSYLLDSVDDSTARDADGIATYEFSSVTDIAVVNTGTRDPAFSHYEFPKTTLIESFDAFPDEGNGIRFEIKGTYAWSISWSALDFQCADRRY